MSVQLFSSAATSVVHFIILKIQLLLLLLLQMMKMQLRTATTTPTNNKTITTCNKKHVMHISTGKMLIYRMF